MMASMKSKTILLLAVLFLLPFDSASAQSSLPFEPGVHYRVLEESQRSPEPELREFFWYGCGSCYAFEPLLRSWHAGKEEQVALVRTPGIWNEQMKTHARVFFAASELGVLERVHQDIFDEIHRHGRTLLEEEEILAFFEARGVERPAMAKALSSFTVDSQARSAQGSMRELRIPAVPSLVVNGRYLVSGNEAVRTHEAILAVVDYLLAL